MSALQGTTLGDRYRLQARIAAGGFATVYRAFDERLERPVAVKLMRWEAARDLSALERFRREARAVAQLSHPNVVGVIDAGEDGGRPYIVFEYVEGETLKQLIRRAGPLPITDAISYAIAIARALGAAHARHIVHRDVKPQNVLIASGGIAKVTDFGIARTLDEDGLTSDGRVLGTTDYVSPEQALGEDVSGRSDLYSLGIVLYEMLTGEVPFRADSQVAVAMCHVREPLPDLRALRPDASAALAAVVETVTAKDAYDRHATAAELIEDLERALALETARARAAGPPTASLPAPAAPRARRADQTGTPARTPAGLPEPAGARPAADPRPPGPRRWSPPRSDSPRRPPARSRPRRLAAAGSLAAMAAAMSVAVAVLAADHRPHRKAQRARPPVAAPPQRVPLCATCAHDYNPDAISGPKSQNPQLVGYAIDGNPSTAWYTQDYYDHRLGKPGVGLYLDARRDVAAGSLRIQTATPGWSATIYATNQTPDPNAFNPGPDGWRAVGAATDVHAIQTIGLHTRSARYRYWLLWITSLGGRESVAVNELSLYTP
ncbi:MAG TPA: protein kinase [Solirubrobacteraceae bacterium]|nr:protein kinase [Solirubrobacteraceae bacterium]